MCGCFYDPDGEYETVGSGMPEHSERVSLRICRHSQIATGRREGLTLSADFGFRWPHCLRSTGRA